MKNNRQAKDCNFLNEHVDAIATGNLVTSFCDCFVTSYIRNFINSCSIRYLATLSRCRVFSHALQKLCVEIQEACQVCLTCLNVLTK